MNNKQKNTSASKTSVITRLWHLGRTKVLLISLIASGILVLLSQNQAWAEWYARTIYPGLSALVATLPALLPFSVAEWVVIGCGVGLMIYLGLNLRRVLKGRGNRGFLLAKMFLGLLAFVSVVLLLFMLLTGVNYHRKEFAELSGLSIEEAGATYNAQELNDLATFLANEMTTSRSALENENELYDASPETFSQYARESVALMQALQSSYPVFDRPLYSPPKPVLSSQALCYANIAGMFFPFTVESNINTEDPFFTQPFTMAHELAHQAGFMREDEANFIAFLTCMESDDPLIRYSGAYQAFVRTLPILRRVDAEAATTLWDHVSDEVKADNAYYSDLLKQYEGPVKEVSTKINDTYLKANSQHDGVAAYDRMVNLLLAWYAEQKTP